MGTFFHAVKYLPEGCVLRGVCMKEHMSDEGVFFKR
jgi:hypothetical protein